MAYPERLTVQGVEVTALQPSVLPQLYKTGQKIASYRIRVRNLAHAPRTIKITKHLAYDRDGQGHGGSDDLIKSWEPYSLTISAGEVREPGFDWVYRDYGDEDELWVELYHLVMFQVLNPVTNWPEPEIPATLWSPRLDALV